jgi:hypothetical protein
VPVLGMSITDLEKLYDHDRHWIYRAIAAQQAETLAQPIRKQHDEQRAKEQEKARKEAARAANREAKRQAWRNARELDALLTEAD